MKDLNPNTPTSNRKKILIGFIITILLISSGPRLDSDLGHEWIVGEDRPLIIAHRGGSDIFPENTMIAFEGAIAIGVDVLEMDFHLTSDNYLVTMHDKSVDRTTNGSGNVRSMTLEEIISLDASAKFSNSNGENPWNNTHVPPVSIGDVLDRFIDSPHRFSFEIKNEGKDGETAAEIMFQEINKRSMGDRIEVGSFHLESLEAFREFSDRTIATSGAESEIQLCLIAPMMQIDRWWLDPGPVSVLQIPIERGGINLATKGIVDRAHQHGQAVQYWTINDKETMDYLVEIGADGIMTDNPITLRESISEAGFEVPKAWIES